MKLPNNFPKELNGEKLLFATRPKCFSGIYDMENRKMLSIEYYAIAESHENSEIKLLSMDGSFNIIDKSHFLTIVEAMSELEPDNISEKDWKELIQ
jgi:hypothetical protein